jgi:hypothetical protein
MGAPRLPEIIQSFFSKAKDGIGGLFRRPLESQGVRRNVLKEKLEALLKQTRMLKQTKLLAMLPADRRIVLTLAIGVPIILLLFITGASMASRDASVRSAAPPAAEITTRRIPAEDLFLPDEPDFVPGVILEREKRTQWTPDDAMPWWQDPLKDGEQEWRDRIEKTVDEIMENVP